MRGGSRTESTTGAILEYIRILIAGSAGPVGPRPENRSRTHCDARARHTPSPQGRRANRCGARRAATGGAPGPGDRGGDPLSTRAAVRKLHPADRVRRGPARARTALLPPARLHGRGRAAAHHRRDPAGHAQRPGRRRGRGHRDRPGLALAHRPAARARAGHAAPRGQGGRPNTRPGQRGLRAGRRRAAGRAPLHHPLALRPDPRPPLPAHPGAAARAVRGRRGDHHRSGRRRRTRRLPARGAPRPRRPGSPGAWSSRPDGAAGRPRTSTTTCPTSCAATRWPTRCPGRSTT